MRYMNVESKLKMGGGANNSLQKARGGVYDVELCLLQLYTYIL